MLPNIEFKKQHGILNGLIATLTFATRKNQNNQKILQNLSKMTSTHLQIRINNVRHDIESLFGSIFYESCGLHRISYRFKEHIWFTRLKENKAPNEIHLCNRLYLELFLSPKAKVFFNSKIVLTTKITF